MAQIDDAHDRCRSAVYNLRHALTLLEAAGLTSRLATVRQLVSDARQQLQWAECQMSLADPKRASSTPSLGSKPSASKRPSKKQSSSSPSTGPAGAASTTPQGGEGHEA